MKLQIDNGLRHDMEITEYREFIRTLAGHLAKLLDNGWRLDTEIEFFK